MKNKTSKFVEEKVLADSEIDKDCCIFREMRMIWISPESCTVEINHRPLIDEHDSHLVPLAGHFLTLFVCMWAR